jgi:hypothetical protein
MIAFGSVPRLHAAGEGVALRVGVRVAVLVGVAVAAPAGVTVRVAVRDGVRVTVLTGCGVRLGVGEAVEATPSRTISSSMMPSATKCAAALPDLSRP